MSCIYGLFARQQREELKFILDEQRGVLKTFEPDDEGYFVNERMAGGHLMVHNTPDSMHDHQPFRDTRAQLYIVGDLRLDNRSDLFHTLNLQPNSETPDIQLVLWMYQLVGEKCVKKLLGDFAFVIFDEGKNELFAARDPLGVKPLYYHLSARWFAFCSRLRGLWPVPGIKKTMQESYVLEMLFAGYPFTKNETCFAEIQRLEGGHAIKVSATGHRKWRYWELTYTGPIIYKQEADYIEHGRYLLNQVIADRCRTKYPLGAQLSGGLDSSGITLLAVKEAAKRNVPFSVYCNKLAEDLIGKAFPFRDERYYIEAVVKAGVIQQVEYLDWRDKNVEFLISQQVDINDGMGNMDYSIFSSVHSTAAAKNGVRTLFSGYPGDEVVTYPGYERIRTLFDDFKFAQGLQELTTCNEYEGSKLKIVLRYLLRRYVPWLLKGYNYIRGYRGVNQYTDNVLNQSYAKEFERLGGIHYNRIWRRTSRVEDGQLLLKENTYQPYRMEAERAGAWDHKVAYTYPFADVRLLDYWLNIPAEMKFKQGTTRYLYRKCMEGIIPPEVLYRRKSEVFFIIPTYFYLLKQGYPQILTMYNELLNSKYYKYINASRLKQMIAGIQQDKLSFDQTAKNALSLYKINFQ